MTPVIEAYGNEVKLRANTINETGNIYGKIKVIAPVRIKNDRKVKWHCVCECGAENYFYGSELREGKRTSCGKHCNSVIEEKPGTVYGFLEVIEKDPRPAYAFPDHCIHWICKCNSCNTIKSVSGQSLRNGDTKSCGCIKSFGEKFISKFLNENNYEYKKEFSFKNLKGDKDFLQFDFAIFENNQLKFLIEFQGRQHFVEVDFFTHDVTLGKRQEYDKLKEQYCIDNNIPLLKIIPADLIRNNKNDFESVGDIIKNFEEELKGEQNVKIFNKYLRSL